MPNIKHFKPSKNTLHHPSHKTNIAIQPMLRLERWQRRCIYLVFSLLFLTGATWVVAHFLLHQASEFGESVHPLEPWAMKIHGAAAMVALFFVGSLLNTHIRRAIKGHRNRFSGWSMIAVIGILTLSGYVLYYLASEQSRPIWSILHWVLGLIFPLILCLHVLRGRRTAA
ncbi:MAG: DUF4405 domain-containing protein [Pseudomonadota bacterium]